MKKTEKFGTYALVTGAASGMGRIYAHRLALMGYNLILVDINALNLQETVESVKSSVAASTADCKERFKVLPLVMDLSEKSAADKVEEAALAGGCEVEVLVNNAGLLPVNETAALPEALISTTVMVHCYTSLMLCRKFVPRMRQHGNGYVLNISSLAAWMPWPVIGLYGNTKRFVKDYSRSLRVECAGTGVSVTTAYFGAVDTPLIKLKPSLRKLAHALAIMISPEKAVDKALKATFKRRKGVMPGFLNHLFRPLIMIMPDWLLGVVFRWARKFLRNSGGNPE